MGKQTKSQKRSGRISWQRILLQVLFIAFVWLVISQFNEVEKLARTLAQGQWQWVLAAGVLQILYYLVFAGTYQAAFYVLGIRRKLFELVPVTLGWRSRMACCRR